jgi:hypothetical protein
LTSKLPSISSINTKHYMILMTPCILYAYIVYPL